MSEINLIMPESSLNITVHLIQKSITRLEFDRQINRMTSKDDCLIFMGDAIFDLSKLSPLLDEKDYNLTINVIDSDVKARAISDILNKKINIISFDEFVLLTIKAKKIISW